MTSSPSSEVIKAWERQPEESEEAFDAFDVYAKMGRDRSIAKAAAEVANSSGSRGKDKSLLERWSAKYRWIVRAAVWDRHVARLENENHLLGRAEMRARHIRDAQKLQGQVARRIETMTDKEIGKLKPAEVVLMLKAAAEIERKAREVTNAEQADNERGDVPAISIQFVHAKPNMIAVRLADGQAGYIPEENIERFLADFVGSVAIR